MYNFLLSIVLCIVFNCHGVANLPLQIVNGTSAKHGEFPYMVQLRESDGFFLCAGSIIGSKWILTAGHCAEGERIKSIVHGTNKLYSTNDGYPNSSIKVKQTYLYPGYFEDGTVPLNDVGIIELETEIPFSANSKPVNLPDNDNIPFHVKGVLTGWGRNETDGDVVPCLQKIYLKLQTGEECTKALNINDNYYNSTLMLCPEVNWNGQCTGDSGGPYVINGTQYGIVSYSDKPCGSSPGVYNRLSFSEYRNWIMKITNL